MLTGVKTSAVSLVVAALVFAGTTLLSGSKSGALTLDSGLCSGPSFCISSPSPGPVLYPVTSTSPNLPLTFSNSLNVPIRVYSLTVSFTNSFPSGCPSTELTLNGQTVSLLSTPVAAPGVTITFSPTFAVLAAVGHTPGTANDRLTLALLDNRQNQDACQGLLLALKYTASAYYTSSTSSVLSSSPSPSIAGQAVTLTDTVTSATDKNVPVGNVLFYSCTSTSVASCSTTPLGSAVPLNATGVATTNTTNTTPATGGTYYYKAVFKPSDVTNFTASTSNVLTQVVNAASSKVFLRSDRDETVVGSQVAYVARVVDDSSFRDRFTTGTMTFKDNGVVISSCANVRVFLGFAICRVTYPSTAGSPHVITATYNGDAHHASGTSNTVNERVERATPPAHGPK